MEYECEFMDGYFSLSARIKMLYLDVIHEDIECSRYEIF